MAYSDWKMILVPVLTTSLIHFSWKGWENVLFELGIERVNMALAKRCSQLKPTRAKFSSPMELGIVWPPTWLESACWTSSNVRRTSSHVFHRLATSANSSQLSPSCFLIVMWLRGRIQSFEWFLVSWLDLAVPFSHPPCKFWFFNLARVGLSWDYRLARALVFRESESFCPSADVRIASSPLSTFE